jgi:hypothetical protein
VAVGGRPEFQPMGLAEAGDELVRFGGGAKCRTKHDAEIQHVKHHQFMRLDPVFGQPSPHLGEMIGNRQRALAGYNNRFQKGTSTKSSPRHSATGCLRLPYAGALRKTFGGIGRIRRSRHYFCHRLR